MSLFPTNSQQAANCRSKKTKANRKRRRSINRNLRIESLERRDLFAGLFGGDGGGGVNITVVPTPEQVVEGAGHIVQGGKELGKQASVAYKDGLQHAQKELDNGAEWFRDRRAELKEAAIKTRDKVDKAWDKAESVAKSALNQAQNELSKALDVAKKTANKAWGEVQKQSAAAAKSIESKAKQVENAWDVVTDTLAKAEKEARNAGKYAEQIARDALGDAKQSVDGLLDQIKKTVVYDHTTPGSLTFNMKEGQSTATSISSMASNSTPRRSKPQSMVGSLCPTST